jgi:hypothetical protein
VELRNPLDEEAAASVALVLSEGWTADPPRAEVELAPRGEATVSFRVTVADEPGRLPVAADVTIGPLALGLHAESLVTVA